MTSVAATTPAARAAREASRLSRTMEAIASGKNWPVALCRLFSTPTPSGLVRVSGSPARAASLRSSRSGSADAGHRHAVLGLRVVDAVAAGDVAPAPRGRCPAPPRSTSRQQLQRQHVPRPAHQVQRDQRLGRPSRTRRRGHWRRRSGRSRTRRPPRREEVGRASRSPGRPRSGPPPRRHPTPGRRAGRATVHGDEAADDAPRARPGGILQAQPPPWAYWVSR